MFGHLMSEFPFPSEVSPAAAAGQAGSKELGSVTEEDARAQSSEQFDKEDIQPLRENASEPRRLQNC